MKAFGLLGLLLVLGIAGWLMMGGPGHSQGGVGDGELAEASRAQAMEASARAAVAGEDLSELRSAIAAFQAAKGRLPGDLNELQTEGFVQRVPAGVDYDPATGDVHPH